MSQSQKNENQLSLMLPIVVGVFLICNTLFLVNILAKALTGSTAVFGVDSMLLWIVNASINFTIYCAYGKKFREVFLEICKKAWSWIAGIPQRLWNYFLYFSIICNTSGVNEIVWNHLKRTDTNNKDNPSWYSTQQRCILRKPRHKFNKDWDWERSLLRWITTIGSVRRWWKKPLPGRKRTRMTC